MTSSGARSRDCLLAALVLGGSSPAFARGGPDGALVSALTIFLQIAIVVGLAAGVICALVLHRPPWKSLVLLSVVALSAAVAFPFGEVFIGVPALVSLAVFASAFYVVRGGVFRARTTASSSAMTANLEGDGGIGSSEVFRWIAATYVFWVAVSLANFELLGFLAIPPLVLISPGSIARFLPFILPPLAAALLVGAFVTAVVVKSRGSGRRMAPLIFNASVLVAFFVSAEVYRHHLMSRSLRDRSPDHLEKSTFLKSVLEYRTYFRERHGGFEENGKIYRWSYSQREFVERPQPAPSDDRS